MKRYKKLVVVLIFVCAFFSGCGEQKNQETAKESVTANRTATESAESSSKETISVVIGGEETKTQEETAPPEESGESELGTLPPVENPSISSSETERQESTDVPTKPYVMPTIRQETQYGWSDVSIVILNTVLTKPDDHPGEPSFAVFNWNGTEEPVMFAGYRQEDGQSEYTIYTFEGNTVIEIGQCSGIVKVNYQTREISFNGLGDWETYRYQDFQLIREDGYQELPPGFEDMKTDSLKANIITSENIRDFMQS